MMADHQADHAKADRHSWGRQVRRCGRWPRTLRATMRCAVNVLPPKETVCDKAFWDNISAKTMRERPN
jgi:hypothetical protein